MHRILVPWILNIHKPLIIAVSNHRHFDKTSLPLDIGLA